MSTTFTPNTAYMQVHWMELEMAMRMMAAPEKLSRVDDLIQSIQALERMAGPDKAIYHLVAGIAWLTDMGAESWDG